MWYRDENKTPWKLTLEQAQDISAAILNGAQHIALFDELIPAWNLMIKPAWGYLEERANLGEKMVGNPAKLEAGKKYVEENFPNGALSRTTLEGLGLLQKSVNLKLNSGD